MVFLLIVSIVWGLSFGLIKGNLTGLDPYFVAFTRLFLSMLIFLPFLKLKHLKGKDSWKLILVGFFQFGVMYGAYIYSYQYLQAYQVALFTVFTPIYISITNDILHKKFHRLNIVVSFLAVLATFIILYRDFFLKNILTGFLLVQVSNLCFAIGQIAYRAIKARLPGIKDHNMFGLLYLGAICATAPLGLASLKTGSLVLESSQILTLVYLGIIASGLGFFLWNYGAARTNVGNLAVLNNLKIPLAVTFSILLFGERASLLRLIIGGILIVAALMINHKFQESNHRGVINQTPISRAGR